MATKRVELKVLSSKEQNVDIYNTLIPNCILNSDGSSSGFLQDNNSKLMVGDEIISKRKLVWSGDIQGTKLTQKSRSMSIDISSSGFTYKTNTYYEIQGYASWQNDKKNYWETTYYFDTGTALGVKGSANIFAQYSPAEEDTPALGFCNVGISLNNNALYLSTNNPYIDGLGVIYSMFDTSTIIGVTAIYEIIK